MSRVILSRRILGVSLVLGCVAAIASAQERTDDYSHRAAAGELLELLSPKDAFKSAFMVGMEPFFRQISAQVSETQLSEIKAAADRLSDKVAADPELSRQLIDVYVKEFSESEIRELLAFYRTPIGKKALAKMPQLMQMGAKIGEQVTSKYLSEYQAEIAQILQK